MVTIRPATTSDLLNVQHLNLLCLKGTYQMKYFLYVDVSWPQLMYVAEDTKGKIVGYVLAKIVEPEEQLGVGTTSAGLGRHGHICSLAVSGSHRRLGIGQKLVDQTSRVMVEVFGVKFVTLHVKDCNRAAHSCYEKTGFHVAQVKEDYYDDGHQAYLMTRDLTRFAKENGIQPLDPVTFFEVKVKGEDDDDMDKNGEDNGCQFISSYGDCPNSDVSDDDLDVLRQYI